MIQNVHGIRVYNVPTGRGDIAQAEISDACQFVTVYRESDGKPVATLNRRRVYASGPNWRAYALDGSEIGNGYALPLSAIKAVIRRANIEAEAAARARAAQAALWTVYRYGCANA
jgi:hypothetical protein